MVYQNDHLEAVTIAKPVNTGGTRSSGGGGSGLIVLAPGYGGAPDVDMIRSLAAAQTRGFDVISLDWEEYGKRHVLHIGADLVTGREGLKTAHDIGESNALWLDSLGANYSSVHIIALSAGNWVADGFVDRWRALHPASTIQFTMLDAYSPPVDLPVSTNVSTASLGDHASWIENYRWGASNPHDAPFCGYLRAGALNIDVSGKVNQPGYENVKDQGPHLWPYNWYEQTAKNPNFPMDVSLGFNNSISRSSSPTWFGTTGQLVFRGNDLFSLSGLTTTTHVQLDASTVIASDTGTINIGADGKVTLTTGSPVMMTVLVDLTASSNYRSFEYETMLDVQGLFSVYLDGQMLLEQSIGNEGYLNMPIPVTTWLVDNYNTWMHTLLFRVDPLTDETTQISVHDVFFGHVDVNVVPEPSSFVSLATGAMLAAVVMLLCRRNRRRVPQ